MILLGNIQYFRKLDLNTNQLRTLGPCSLFISGHGPLLFHLLPMHVAFVASIDRSCDFPIKLFTFHLVARVTKLSRSNEDNNIFYDTLLLLTISLLMKFQTNKERTFHVVIIVSLSVLYSFISSSLPSLAIWQRVSHCSLKEKIKESWKKLIIRFCFMAYHQKVRNYPSQYLLRSTPPPRRLFDKNENWIEKLIMRNIWTINLN